MSLKQSHNFSIIRSRYIYFTILLLTLSIALLYQTSSTQQPPTIMSPDLHHTPPSSRKKKTPVYFLGIGGPNFMEDTTHPAYAKLASIGHEITTKVKPKAVVVFCAHWQAGPNKIEINVAEHTDLIYDFYGFPPHYYEYEYPNRGSPEVAEMVRGRLEAVGIEVEGVRRGLDHGVWAGFMVGMWWCFLRLERGILFADAVDYSFRSEEESVGGTDRAGFALWERGYGSALSDGAGAGEFEGGRYFDHWCGDGELFGFLCLRGACS